MPVNETLSQFSDWSYNTATVIYLLAMLFFLVEQSFGLKGRRLAERSREVVGAGGPPATLGTSTVPSATWGTSGGGRPARFGRMGVALTVLGALLHLAALTLRGLAVGRVPWGNMYEYSMAFTFIAVLTWLVVLRKYPVRHLTSFVLLPVVILLFIGGTLLYTTAAPVQPALQSYWLVIHVAAIVVGSGIFLVPGVASVMYLMRAAHQNNPERFAKLSGHLPPLDALDRVSYRTTVLAFPIYTFGVLCGAIWAEAAWGRYWGWDPKEVWSLVTWVVYAAYLHARATAGWRGRRAAIIAIVGWFVFIFNFVGVNLLVSGLHSYAGI